jgi:hypothetical protein
VKICFVYNPHLDAVTAGKYLSFGMKTGRSEKDALCQFKASANKISYSTVQDCYAESNQDMYQKKNSLNRHYQITSEYAADNLNVICCLNAIEYSILWPVVKLDIIVITTLKPT